MGVVAETLAGGEAAARVACCGSGGTSGRGRAFASTGFGMALDLGAPLLDARSSVDWAEPVPSRAGVDMGAVWAPGKAISDAESENDASEKCGLSAGAERSPKDPSV